MTAIRKESPNAGPSATPARMVSGEPLRQRIAEKAYELFLRRGQAPGHDVEDWLEAERLVRMLQVRESTASPSSPARRPTGRLERKGSMTPRP